MNVRIKQTFKFNHRFFNYKLSLNKKQTEKLIDLCLCAVVFILGFIGIYNIPFITQELSAGSLIVIPLLFVGTILGAVGMVVSIYHINDLRGR